MVCAVCPTMFLLTCCYHLIMPLQGYLGPQSISQFFGYHISATKRHHSFLTCVGLAAVTLPVKVTLIYNSSALDLRDFCNDWPSVFVGIQPAFFLTRVYRIKGHRERLGKIFVNICNHPIHWPKILFDKISYRGSLPYLSQTQTFLLSSNVTIFYHTTCFTCDWCRVCSKFL